jgi:hypothetical protein
MFTALAFGLCAMVLEGLANEPIGGPAIQYPAVGIGTVVGNRCRKELVLAADTITPGIPINGRAYRFKVGTVDHSSAVIWVNDQQFTIPRPSF